jgi:aerobic-type carbon monoxide dehydrogenase small subunit (CoxS/CutS family)
VTDRHHLRFKVNGTPHELEVDSRHTLADVLREDLGLSGTHLGCEHGICGACSVLIDGEPMRSCLVFAVQVHGQRVETVEGLVRDPHGAQLQAAFSRHRALQCGFCTPGFLMIATALLRDEPDLTREGIREAMSANLCRCTGYTPIIDAIEDVAATLRPQPDDVSRRRDPGS